MPADLVIPARQVAFDQSVQQFDDPGSVIFHGHEVSGFFDCGQGIGDSNRQFAQVQERMIVFGIANTHDVMS
jgi:hypothetical protein